MWLLFLTIAVTAAVVSCVRVCRAAAVPLPGDAASKAPSPREPDGPTLYETAFLAGGPDRVADVTLVSMARQRRLLLAPTGWATVVDPVGRDAVECAVLAAIGPGGQHRIPAVREGLARTPTLRSLADELVATGLTPSAAGRTGVGTAVRQVRAATLLILLAAAAALWSGPQDRDTGLLLAWFALPLILTTGTWAMARGEARPAARWATTAGEHLLRRAAARVTPAGCGQRAGARDALTALALHGPRTLADPALRAALHSSGA
ncbi:TIGR04222 domain-containing membrane protein [Streptomyces pinistramenti]|uniref:TIGR04222 domain-containing membrane protein n=1 Tax=Streptomyces pinistramenti TaxID=2884812 RepID=UPI001D08D5DA|nr:TIGR04222 domain-containing membrane protein [Streptomyces pinistramenti]MCB5906609.1 TIGR04222 domain-containing membrane protein [Streptomyces pinistramenti]